MVCVLLFLSLPTVWGQTYSVKGQLIDAATSNKIEGAQVALYTDTIATGKPRYFTTSDKGGKFVVKEVARNTYLLSITCVGYKPLQLSVVDLSGDIDLGTLELREESVVLSEVTVSSTAQTRADRWVFFPSKKVRQQSTDALDVLHRMRLPNMHFDMVNRTISSLKQGALQIRIDGKLSKQSDLFALMPQEIAKVEYIDNPSLRYGEQVGAVINITTKRSYEGLQGGVWLSSAVTTAQVNGNTYFKWIGKQDYLNLKLNGAYQNVGGIHTNKVQYFHFPTEIMQLDAKGKY